MKNNPSHTVRSQLRVMMKTCLIIWSLRVEEVIMLPKPKQSHQNQQLCRPQIICVQSPLVFTPECLTQFNVVCKCNVKVK